MQGRRSKLETEKLAGECSGPEEFGKSVVGPKSNVTFSTSVCGQVCVHVRMHACTCTHTHMRNKEKRKAGYSTISELYLWGNVCYGVQEN